VLHANSMLAPGTMQPRLGAANVPNKMRVAKFNGFLMIENRLWPTASSYLRGAAAPRPRSMSGHAKNGAQQQIFSAAWQ
jgi:hypothetical protein